MPRRSRTRGASGSSKTKRPPAATPEAHREFEALLDEVYDTMMNRDADRLTAVMEQIAAAPPFAPELITRRLIEGRERAPGIMLSLLTEIAPDRWEIMLERIVKAREAPDQVRYEAQRVLGWDVPREQKRRVGFLKSLRDPDGALATSTETAGITWPARIEALSDVDGYLRALQPPARYLALDRIIEDAGWNAIPLLHGLVHAEDPVVQRKAIDGLAEQRFSASPGPLRRLARTTRNDDVRQHVEDILASVVFDRVAAPEDGPDEPMFPAGGLKPLSWARVTRVDPDGGQALWVTRRVGEGIYDTTNFYVNGKSGLTEIYQYGPLTDELLEAYVLDIDGEIAPWTTIDLAVARGLIEHAVELYAGTGLPVPFVFELYEPMLHDSYPPLPNEPVAVPVLDDTAYAGRADLIERGAELLDHPLFNEWVYRIDDVMAALTLGPFSRLDPDITVKDPSLARQLLKPPARPILSDALRRQAWLLDTAGSGDERDIALALAAWIPDASEDELAGNGFVNALTLLSIGMTTRMLGAPPLFAGLDGLDLDDLLLGDDDDLEPDLNLDADAIEADWTPASEEPTADESGREQTEGPSDD